MPAKTTRPATPRKTAARTRTRPTAQQKAAAEKQRRAVELRTTGMSFDAIADELGYTDRGSAHKAYLAGLAQLPELEEHQRATFLQIEAARLDALQKALWPNAMKGDPETVRAVLRVMERRAKLFGLDAPTKSEHKVTTELDEQIEELLSEMEKLADRKPG